MAARICDDAGWRATAVTPRTTCKTGTNDTRNQNDVARAVNERDTQPRRP